MGTQKDKFFLGIFFYKNILNQFHRTFRKIVECRIGTRRIGSRIGILRSRMPTATSLIVYLRHNVLVLDVPVVVQLRKRIALVVRLATSLGHGFHRLVSTQKFRCTQNKVFLELFESSADLFGLFFSIIRKRSALTRVIAAFCMAQNENHAFIVLDTFIDILNIDKLFHARFKNKVTVFFNSGRLAPRLLRPVIRQEFTRKRTATDLTVFRRRRIPHKILQAIGNSSPTVLFITDKAILRFRNIVVLRSIELARLIYDKENTPRRLRVATREIEFTQIEVLEILFKASSLAHPFFKGLANRRVTILDVILKRPVRNRQTSIAIVPLAVLAHIR